MSLPVADAVTPLSIVGRLEPDEANWHAPLLIVGTTYPWDLASYGAPMDGRRAYLVVTAPPVDLDAAGRPLAAMLVTTNQFSAPGYPDRTAADIHVVSKVPWLRNDAKDSLTPAVCVGRWMLDRGLFTHHSGLRTDAGDRWAHAVGGIIPERVQHEDGPDHATAEVWSLFDEFDWVQVAHSLSE